MRSQKVCLLPSSARRGGPPAYVTPILLKQTARQTRSRSFVVLSQHPCRKPARLSVENYKKKRVFFVSLGGTRSLEGRRRYTYQAKAASNSTRSFIALVPTSQLKISAAFCLKTIRKSEGFRQSRPPKEEGRESAYTCQAKPPQTPSDPL